MLELWRFLCRVVWQLKQPLPTTGTQRSPRSGCHHLSAKMLRQPPETPHQLSPLESHTLVPH